MLAVAVDADREVVSVLRCVAEAGLDRAADTEIERQYDDMSAPPGRACPGRVLRRVVDDDDVEVGIERAQLVDHLADRALLVEGRDDRDPLHAGTPTSTRESNWRARCR